MDPFRLAFLLMFLSMAAIRVTWARRAEVLEPGAEDRSEGAWVAPVRLVFLPAYLGAVALWLAWPEAVAVFDVPLPAAVRWSGLAIYAPGLALLAWVHWTLGTNFSHRLRIRGDHTLVTTGPYRWVRHPMYTAFLLLALSYGLVTASWIFLVLPPGMLLAVLISRTPREEAMLEDRFGEHWQAYRARTWRLVPLVW